MNPEFPALPEALREDAEEAFSEFCEAHTSESFAEHRDALLRLFAASPFCIKLALSHPERVASFLQDPTSRLDLQQLQECDDAGEFARQLRLSRAQEMMRIAYCDLNGRAELEETLHDLTAFADSAVLAARDWHQAQMTQEPPLEADGTPVPLLILGMGKLGGAELNFSSDIDLIFSYPDPESDREEAQEYFIRLGQRLIKALDEVTADGFVFRVDMRLRPFGSTGALALPFSSMEAYYQHHGRDWERYALLKARVMGPASADGETLIGLLQPFIYRRFLDFNVMEELREMKLKMEQHAQREHLAGDLKHGPGGIREAEFIVQCSQLIFGGQVPELRLTSWHGALDALLETRKITVEDAAPLREAYNFLRRVENRVQMMEDQQVHGLPNTELPRQRLRFAMGFDSWDAFMQTLDEHREHLHEEFTRLLHVPQETPTPRSAEQTLAHLVQDIEADPNEKVDLTGALSELGLDDSEEPARRLFGIFGHALWRMQSDNTHRLMLALIPHLIDAANQQDNPGETATRLFELLATLLHQPSHLAMLQENPKTLELLARIVGSSSLLLSQLLRSPDLIDELLDVEVLFTQPTAESIQEELDHVMRYAGEDLEEQMQALRRFRQAQMFRVAVCDVMDARPIPTSDVSDELTWIAEAVTRCAWALSLEEQTKRHGHPRCQDGDQSHKAQGAVLAYGKFGGLELGYTSDLDLVFVHNSCGEEQHTDGEQSVDNEYFFSRVAQRFIHIMETLTPDGVLYEIDPQLRPGGKFGLTVCSLQYYEKYLQEKAWTWEHQSLIRARLIVGDNSIRKTFEDIRARILCVPREQDTLQKEFTEMRQKMYDAHKGDASRFDLKADPGGITDLEFLVQYVTLMHAAEHPEIIDVTATVMILDRLAQREVLETEIAEFLRSCYFLFRDRAHTLSLQGLPAIVASDEMSESRTRLRALWDETFGVGIIKES